MLAYAHIDGGDTVAGAYADNEPVGSDDDAAWGAGTGRRPWRPRRDVRIPTRADALDEAGAYNDRFDFPTNLGSDDWLQSFDIPRLVLRHDGLPVPFTPADSVHTATFSAGSHVESEARRWYCTLAWTEQAFNELLAAHTRPVNTVNSLQELFAYLAASTRRIYALGVSRYDFLALHQSEPNLADAFPHADAVSRSSLRGDGARRFISRVVRAETSASAKISAAERGYAYLGRGAFAGAARHARGDPDAPRNAGRDVAGGAAVAPRRGGRVGGGGGGRGGGGGGGRGRGGGRV